MNVEEIFDEIDEKKKEVEKIKEKLDRMEGTMAMEAFGVRVKGLRVCRTGKGKDAEIVLPRVEITKWDKEFVDKGAEGEVCGSEAS